MEERQLKLKKVPPYQSCDDWPFCSVCNESDHHATVANNKVGADAPQGAAGKIQETIRNLPETI